MNVYLVWEIESFSDSNVVRVFSDKEKADEFIKTIKVNEDYYPHFDIEEKLVE
jgi:hypothetical protein